MTKKQKITAVLALAFAFSLGMAVMCGCSYFTQEKVAEIHKTVGIILDIAYTSGGTVLVEQKIEQLVTDGKITVQQGEMLKRCSILDNIEIGYSSNTQMLEQHTIN